MMNFIKRLISFTLIAVSIISLSGCFPASVDMVLDTDKPWGKDLYAFERSVYNVKKVERVNGDDGDILADGELIQELSTRDVNGINIATLTSSFTITYRNTEKNGLDSGKTDTINSEVIFTTQSCKPLTVTKSAVIAPRYDSKNGTYLKNDSYTYSADYNERKANISIFKTVTSDGTLPDKYDDISEFEIKTGNVIFFDNEQLFFVLRAFENTATGNNLNYSIFNVLDSYIYGNQKPYEMKTAINDSVVPVTIDEFIKPYSNNETIINCLVATIEKNATNKPGPAITAYISDPSIEFKLNLDGTTSDRITKKIVTKIITKEYDYETIKESANFVYTLSDYSAIK